MSDATKIDDGGPAFPQSLANDMLGGIRVSYDHQDGAGMSLRDYFAGQVLLDASRWEDLTLLARYAYSVADAMLEARKKGGA